MDLQGVATRPVGTCQESRHTRFSHRSVNPHQPTHTYIATYTLAYTASIYQPILFTQYYQPTLSIHPTTLSTTPYHHQLLSTLLSHSLTHLHSLIYIHSLNQSIIYSFTHLLTQSLIHTFTPQGGAQAAGELDAKRAIDQVGPFFPHTLLITI